MMRFLNCLILMLILSAVSCKPEAQAVPSALEEESRGADATKAKDGNEDDMDAAGASSGAYDDDRMARVGMPRGIAEEYYSCLKKGNYATLDSIQCVSQETSRQDKRLNEIYQELLDKLGGNKKERLIDAQRAWLSLRSKDESLEAILYGDEQVENAQIALNELVRVAQRADLLDKYLGPAEMNGN